MRDDTRTEASNPRILEASPRVLEAGTARKQPGILAAEQAA